MSDLLTKKKQQAIEHICYEVISLMRAHRFWSRTSLSRLNQAEKNILIEHTALHIRNMADFFECSKKTNEIRDKKAQEDDVIAEDYGCPPRSLVNGGILTRINKEIAHLTYTRCGKSLEEKRWDEVFPAIVPDLLRESSQFLEHVKKHYGPQLTTEPMSHIESTLGSLKQCDVDC